MKEFNILNSFNSLRNSSQNVQTKAGIQILKHLLLKQKEFGKDEPCKELQLAVNRVVRGLGAPRSDSRSGFFLTFIGLCELFSTPTFTLEMCLNAIKKELTDSASKGEENDMYKGQVLTYGGLIQSNKILEANNTEREEIIRQLILIGSKKSNLNLAAHTFLIEYIKKVDEKSFKKSVWPIVLPEIILKENNKSLQWYHLLSVIKETFPGYVDKKILIDLIGYPNLYDEGNLESITNLLLIIPLNSVFIDSPMYQDVLHNIINKKKTLKLFWLTVDSRLSSVTTALITHVVRLFIFCCQHLNDKNLITYLLTPNFVNIFELKNNMLNTEEIRQLALEQLLKTVSEKGVLKSDAQLEIVQKLFFYSTNLDLLRGFGFKIFLAMINNFDEETVKSVCKTFTDVLCGNSTNIIGKKSDKKPVDTQWKDTDKKIACTIITKLINHTSVINCVDWKVDQMKIIMNAAFFSNQISSEMSQSAKQCFFSGLDIKFLKLTDLCTYLNEIVTFLNHRMLSDSKSSIEFSKETKKCWKKMINVVKEITEDKCETDSDKLINTLFHILFLTLGVTILKDPESAVDSLDELVKVYKHKCHALKDSDDKEEPYWTDVLVELILSLLSNDNHFLRNVITKVFSFLCSHLSSQNIHQFLNVLNPNVDNVMQNTDAVEEDEKNSSEGSDEESDSSKDEGDSDESELEEEEEAEGDLDKLRVTLRSALGDNAAMTDNESVDLDDLDEEEGNRIDRSLSEAFKQLKQSKLKANSVEQKALSDFRTRVIDLLKTWVKSEPPLNVIFEVMVTVLMLLEKSLQTGTDLQLQSVLKTFLKQLTSVKEFSTQENINVKELSKLIKKLIDKDEKSTTVYVGMSQQIVDCCTFILKISMRDFDQVKELRPKILKTYKKALKDFFDKTNPIVPAGLFQSALDLPWEGSFVIARSISDCIFNPEVRPFHIKHGLDLLQTFIKNKRLFTVDLSATQSDDLVYIVSKLLENTTAFQGKLNKYYAQYVGICRGIVNLNTTVNIIGENEINKLKLVSSKKRKLGETTLAGPVETKKVKNSTSVCEVDADDSQDNDKSAKVKDKKKRGKARQLTEMKAKKKRKYLRSENMSQGVEEGIFGSSLFTNSAYMEGDIENEEDNGEENDNEES